MTRDELLGQQLPCGDHREQNRHVAGGKAMGTSLRGGHRWLHKFRLFALIGHGTSKDFSELENVAAKEGPYENL